MTIFSVDENFISSMLGYVGNVFDDLKPLIFLMIGLFVGFFIVEKILEIILFKTEKK